MIAENIHRRDVDKMYLSDNDKCYINKHIKVLFLLNDNLYAAPKNPTAVYDISTALNGFANHIL